MAWPIPGAEGRAGMAALVVGDGFDLVGFRDHLDARLPTYACPVFIRICTALDLTETFKQKKQELMREGFNPRFADGPMFFRDTAGNYSKISADVYVEILEGALRL